MCRVCLYLFILSSSIETVLSMKCILFFCIFKPIHLLLYNNVWSMLGVGIFFFTISIFILFLCQNECHLIIFKLNDYFIYHPYNFFNWLLYQLILLKYFARTCFEFIQTKNNAKTYSIEKTSHIEIVVPIFFYIRA